VGGGYGYGTGLGTGYNGGGIGVSYPGVTGFAQQQNLNIFSAQVDYLVGGGRTLFARWQSLDTRSPYAASETQFGGGSYRSAANTRRAVGTIGFYLPFTSIMGPDHRVEPDPPDRPRQLPLFLQRAHDEHGPVGALLRRCPQCAFSGENHVDLSFVSGRAAAPRRSSRRSCCWPSVRSKRPGRSNRRRRRSAIETSSNQRFATVSDGPQSSLIVDVGRRATGADIARSVRSRVRADWAARGRALGPQLAALGRRNGRKSAGVLPVSTLVTVRRDGKLVLPARKTRAFGGGALTFTYSGWSAREEVVLRQFQDAFYRAHPEPVRRAAWSGNVEVVNVGLDRKQPDPRREAARLRRLRRQQQPHPAAPRSNRRSPRRWRSCCS
jgi:hypothetical protein